MKSSVFKLTLAAAAIASLAGCAANVANTAMTKNATESAQEITRNVAGQKIPVNESTIGTATAAETAQKARTASVAKRATSSWVGGRTVSVTSDNQLPAAFYERMAFNFDDRSSGGTVSLPIVAERITRLSGVPVRISGDVYPVASSTAAAPVRTAAQAATPSAGTPAPSPLPTGSVRPDANQQAQAAQMALDAQAIAANRPDRYNQPVISLNVIDMHWNGGLAGFLDHVTGRLNLSWSYREGVIVIERYVTESFEFAAFGGSQDYRMSLGGNTGAGNASIDVMESGKVEVLTSIKTSLDQMLKATNGSSVLNLSTGRITVTATKDVMNRVRELLKQEDASLQRQAQIQIDVYSVTTNNGDEQGVDWNVLFSKVSESWGATLKSPATLNSANAATVGFNILTGLNTETSKEFGGSSAVIKALNEFGTTAKVRPITMVALNRQWARKTNINTNTYVSETTSSSSSGGTTGGQKTAAIVTGDKLMVQPAILDNGQIVLKFGISLTELVSLLTVSSGSGASLSSVQTPNTSGIDDQSTVRLRPGEAMVVTGLSRQIAENKTRTLGESVSVGVGGTQSQSFKREEFLIVVRAAQI